jgi:hypothetical protein
MRKSTMCKVTNAYHGEMISVKNNGDVMCFKSFSDAWTFATDPIDAELLGAVELIEVNGAPPGRQGAELYELDEKDEIAKDLWQRIPFKGDT